MILVTEFQVGHFSRERKYWTFIVWRVLLKSKKKYLDAATSTVLTTDMWTSRATEAYLTVTCHVTDGSWQMQAYGLESSSFSGKHSADVCSELKRTTCSITVKIQAVVIDNGANMFAAVCKARWAHYPCSAHAINLVEKDSIKTRPELLDIQQRCSAIVSFFLFCHSTKATEKLKEIQKQLKLGWSQPHPISWNMLELCIIHV